MDVINSTCLPHSRFFQFFKSELLFSIYHPDCSKLFSIPQIFQQLLIVQKALLSSGIPPSLICFYASLYPATVIIICKTVSQLNLCLNPNWYSVKILMYQTYIPCYWYVITNYRKLQAKSQFTEKVTHNVTVVYTNMIIR